ncbi:MAG: DUF1844 domain-containing protein [Planctomycetaceae bacterium]|nr:DUF1844 domain-containing protein [Planctomycetaceae bacterium]
MPDDTQPAPEPEVDPATNLADERAQALENLPVPQFGTLIQLLTSQSLLALGVLPGPDGKAQRELPLAKHFIDLIGILEAKTKGNLTPEEEKHLSATLHDLRMMYVEQSKG